MYCSVSGEIPQDPVISKKSGYLFERRIILKFLEEGGKCPITGESLDKDDLIPVNANKSIRPRPLNATSIPGLLTLFQNEWDDLMLETYTLKQHLDATRQELSQALYQHDAACRVIARLIQERDEARAMLNSLQSQGISITSVEPGNGHDTSKEGMEVVQTNKPEEEGGSLDENVLSKIMDKCNQLSKGRKGRKAPTDLTNRDTVIAFQPVENWTPHDSSKAGITSLAISTSEDGTFALTGGVDKSVIFTDVSSGRVLSRLVGHSKRVNCVALSSSPTPIAFSGSSDRQVKVWQPMGNSGDGTLQYSEALTFAKHEGEVTGITVHPTNDFLVSVSKDSSWCFNDITRGVCLAQKKLDPEVGGLLCSQFHPDGLILATGTEAGVVKLWDIRERQNVANCEEHQGAVLSLSFNENGYLLASGGADGSAKIWDLRKIKSLHSISTQENLPASAVAFDYSGTYLAVGADNGSISVSVIKEWNPIMHLSTHTKSVTGVAWGRNASSLVSTSMDRTLRVNRFS